ncbi:MAG: trypsin-like peptidase domain-containing protein [Candidatus Rokubacteria bacterium]|nr:trypsin-like peptidase domain-containing protein [Candidatus Rokubacteria bacterium]
MRRQRLTRVKSLLLPGIVAVVLCLGVAVAHWRPWSRGSAPLRAAGSSVFPLLTEVDFDTGEESPERATVEGTGTVFFGQFVLTVAHAVTLERLEMKVRTPRGEMTLPVEGRRVSEKTWLIAGERRLPLTPLARDEEADLALFLLPRGTDLPAFPYPIGNSETLDLGDPIAVLGCDPVAGVLFRQGSVAALRGSARVARLSDSDRVFLISLALTEGESGAPILAARGGAYELVGLAQGTYIGPRQLAWAVRIGPALEALSRRDGSSKIRQFLRLCRRTQMATLAEPRDRTSGGDRRYDGDRRSDTGAPPAAGRTR